MSKGTEKFTERIHTVEFGNQNLLKSNNRLSDRISLQGDNLNPSQIASKDKMLSLKKKIKLHTLESHAHNKDQRLGGSMKSLEIYTGQEIHTLQKTVVKRLKQLRKLLELMTGERRYKERIQHHQLLLEMIYPGF